jgi:hypothetical protein
MHDYCIKNVQKSVVRSTYFDFEENHKITNKKHLRSSGPCSASNIRSLGIRPQLIKYVNGSESYREKTDDQETFGRHNEKRPNRLTTSFSCLGSQATSESRHLDGRRRTYVRTLSGISSHPLRVHTAKSFKTWSFKTWLKSLWRGIYIDKTAQQTLLVDKKKNCNINYKGYAYCQQTITYLWSKYNELGGDGASNSEALWVEKFSVSVSRE